MEFAWRLLNNTGKYNLWNLQDCNSQSTYRDLERVCYLKLLLFARYQRTSMSVISLIRNGTLKETLGLSLLSFQ